MFSSRRRQRRVGSLASLLLLFTLLSTGLLPVLDSAAQVDSPNLQANPTETPEPPVRVNPTEVPPRETEIPDEIQANPTAAPTEDLPLAIEEPATVTLSKGVCDDEGFDAYAAVGLEAFLDACMAPDGEFEFTVSDGAGFAATSFTSLGSVQFEVPVGTMVITETIPAGWGDPAVFCHSDLYPVPAAQPFIGNGPSWDVVAGEQVECSWFNIAQPADAASDHTVLVSKAVCPEGVSLAEDYWTLANSCTERMEGVGFSLGTEGGSVDALTDANGDIEWTGVDLGASGQISIDEEIPDGYGEPAVWCVSFPQEAADAQDFDFFAAPSADGLVTVEPDQTAPHIFSCAYFNQADGSDGPGELADPSQQGAGEGGANVTFIKHRCPLGVPEDSTLDQYVVICAELMPGISLTMEHEGGLFPAETGDDGQAEWTGVPAGDVEVTEDIPEGYKDPLAFCAMFDGAQELQSGQEQSNGGVVPLAIPDDATDVACHLFNIQDPDLFVPEPESRVVVNKRICDPNVDLVLTNNNPIDTIINACPTEGNGIEFTLDHAGGSSTQAIENGGTHWDDVPNGPITITEHIPDGYGEPVWFCGSNLLDEAGDIDVNGMVSPRLAPAGVLSESLDEEFGEIFYCWVFNVESDDAALTMMKWTCPAGYDVHAPGADPEADCTEAANGIPFQFGQPGLGNLAELQETGDVIDGGVRFTHLEPGNWKLTELAPSWVESAFVGSCTVNGGPWPGGVPLSEGFELEMDLAASQSILCDWYNVPKDGNSLIVHKFLCPLTFDAEVDDKATECTEPMGGVTFTLGDLEATTGDDQGVATFDNVPNGDYSLTEVLPDGVSVAHVGGCSVNGMPVLIAVLQTDPPSVPFNLNGGKHWECTWYNEQEEPEDNSVEIRKWQCPEGTDPDQPQVWFQANCLAQHDGVLFSVASDLGVAALPTVGGAVDFPVLPTGQVGIQEHIPDGFGSPVVFCQSIGGWQQYPAPTGHWDYDFIADGESEVLTCHVYNIPGGDGDVTILKWTCPPGYDLFAAGADPQVDCTELIDGVQFQFGPDEGLAGVAELQTTGDLIPGGVFFGDLEPDVYKAVELVPDGIEQVFVLECTGHIMGMLQPYPLSMGNVLNGIDLDAGEHLVCHWYNVPDDEPGDGSLTVIKYTCGTETFISEVDCQIYEDGKTFDLLLWNTVSGEWDVIDTEVTDGVGRIDWPSIEPGDYSLDEHDGDWCHLATEPVFGPGDGFSVFEDGETVVHVYNCDGTPGERGDTPGKYPNTGVPPTSGGSGAATELPALGGLLGLAITRRRLVAGVGLSLAGSAALGRGVLAQDIQPREATPDAGTPASLCLPATPDADGETGCPRGAVPAGLRIAAIGVDAPVEILETVQGVMQQPSDETHVAWYKESARIGEIGNMYFAGHLNWWGIAQAVFFNLGTLQEGDLVEVTDEEESTASYAVEWVRQESNLEPPREEALGMTDYEAVTLMTCSGEWNSELSEYDSRTVARARRVENDATPAA